MAFKIAPMNENFPEYLWQVVKPDPASFEWVSCAVIGAALTAKFGAAPYRSILPRWVEQACKLAGVPLRRTRGGGCVRYYGLTLL
jgi:hypothetical protein